MRRSDLIALMIADLRANITGSKPLARRCRHLSPVPTPAAPAQPAGRPGEPGIERCKAAAKAGLGQVKGIGEIQPPAIPGEGLADRGGAVYGQALDRKHVLEHGRNVLRRHSIGTAQHPFEFFDHGDRNEQLLAR